MTSFAIRRFARLIAFVWCVRAYRLDEVYFSSFWTSLGSINWTNLVELDQANSSALFIKKKSCLSDVVHSKFDAHCCVASLFTDNTVSYIIIIITYRLLLISYWANFLKKLNSIWVAYRLDIADRGSSAGVTPRYVMNLDSGCCITQSSLKSNLANLHRWAAASFKELFAKRWTNN